MIFQDHFINHHLRTTKQDIQVKKKLMNMILEKCLDRELPPIIEMINLKTALNELPKTYLRKDQMNKEQEYLEGRLTQMNNFLEEGKTEKSI